MANKKSRPQKMALSDFLGERPTGLWADEVDDILTAPAARDEHAPAWEDRHDYRSRPRSPPYRTLHDRASNIPFSSRFSVPKIPSELPTDPPFTVHVANLSFDAVEDDLAYFFSHLKIKDIRIPRNHFLNRSKGYGYVEFEDRDSLKLALELSDEPLHRRSLQISVASPPRAPRDQPELSLNRADMATSWRRATPPSFNTQDNYGERRLQRDNFKREYSFPKVRTRLQLQPRSTEPRQHANPAPQDGRRPNPFGDAKPVDTDQVLKRIEEKIRRPS